MGRKIMKYVAVIAFVVLLALPQALISHADDGPGQPPIPTPTATPLGGDGWDLGWGG